MFDGKFRRTGVVLLTEERPLPLREKVGRWGLAENIWVLYRHDAYGKPWQDIIAQAVQFAERVGAGLLVVDTLTEWAEIEDENDAARVLKAMRPLQAAAGAGLAVCCLLHHRKMAGSFGERVRGSNAVVGAADIVLELSRCDGSFPRTARVLRSLSRFQSTPEEVVLNLTDDGYEVLGDGPDARAENERMRVRKALEEAFDSLTAEELARDLDLPKATVHKRLKELEASAAVERSGAGVKGDPYRWRASGFDSSHADT